MKRESPRILVGAASRAAPSSSWGPVRLGSADLRMHRHASRHFPPYALKTTQSDAAETFRFGAQRSAQPQLITDGRGVAASGARCAPTRTKRRPRAHDGCAARWPFESGRRRSRRVRPERRHDFCESDAIRTATKIFASIPANRRETCRCSAGRGCDIVFAPDDDSIYRPNHATLHRRRADRHTCWKASFGQLIFAASPPS